MQIVEQAYHRNGVSGAPFHIFRFTEDGRNMVAIVFPDYPMATAVFDADKIGAGDIAFGSNSWRGDTYNTRLRNAIDPD